MGPLSILADAGDQRAVGPLNELVQSPACSYHVARKYLTSLRKIGNAESIEALRKMPLRRTHEGINRTAGLAEKCITARLKGARVSPNAEEELHALVKRLMQAVEEKNYEAFISLWPYGFKEAMDEGEAEREVFENKEITAMLELLGTKLPGSRFELGEGGLEAVLLFGQNHRVECVLEIDRAIASKSPSPGAPAGSPPPDRL